MSATTTSGRGTADREAREFEIHSLIAIVSLFACLQASIATYTEKSSGDALAALLKLTSPTCRVRRHSVASVSASASSAESSKDSEMKTTAAASIAQAATSLDLETAAAPAYLPAPDTLPKGELVISSRELVVGDLVLLESGNVIPADVRLLHCTDCRVDESMLTGESTDVTKDHLWRARSGGKELLSPPNMLFSGTHMVTGKAIGIVTSTGMRTRIGRIAALLVASEQEESEEEAAPCKW